MGSAAREAIVGGGRRSGWFEGFGMLIGAGWRSESMEVATQLPEGSW